MKKLKIKFCFVILIVIGFVKLNAQECQSASGGNASGTGGVVNYTVGQITYSTYTGINGSATQGVQQLYVVSVYTGMEEKIVTLNLSIYPNPTNGFLILKLNDLDSSTFSAQLFNANAKVIDNFKITSNETNVLMDGKIAGVYFLKVFKDNNEIKSFKIIKN